LTFQAFPAHFRNEEHGNVFSVASVLQNPAWLRMAAAANGHWRGIQALHSRPDLEKRSKADHPGIVRIFAYLDSCEQLNFALR
jgi:hypothetical protein